MKTKEEELKENDLGYFRSYNYDNDNKVKLCEHIEITGKLMNNDDGCEYIENIEITCNECHTTFLLRECIN